MKILRPFGDWIEAVDVPIPEQRTASGIHIAKADGREAADDPTRLAVRAARIVKVGAGRLNPDRTGTVPMRVSEGEVVLYNMDHAHPMIAEGRNTVLFPEGAVLAVVDLEEKVADARVSELLKA